mgnify:FL=1
MKKGEVDLSGATFEAKSAQACLEVMRDSIAGTLANLPNGDNTLRLWALAEQMEDAIGNALARMEHILKDLGKASEMPTKGERGPDNAEA